MVRSSPWTELELRYGPICSKLSPLHRLSQGLTVVGTPSLMRRPPRINFPWWPTYVRARYPLSALLKFIAFIYFIRAQVHLSKENAVLSIYVFIIYRHRLHSRA